jgi:hypothetical protein
MASHFVHLNHPLSFLIPIRYALALVLISLQGVLRRRRRSQFFDVPCVRPIFLVGAYHMIDHVIIIPFLSWFPFDIR